MQEKELTAKDIPMGYPLCFRKYYGSAVFPLAWKDGKCKCFREKKLVNKAWGFMSHQGQDTL